jgi:hypothetical protein
MGRDFIWVRKEDFTTEGTENTEKKEEERGKG